MGVRLQPPRRVHDRSTGSADAGNRTASPRRDESHSTLPVLNTGTEHARPAIRWSHEPRWGVCPVEGMRWPVRCPEPPGRSPDAKRYIYPMVRALVVGAASFERDHGGEWDPSITTTRQFPPLPAVLPAVHDLSRALSRLGGVEVMGGGPLENPDLETVKEAWRSLRNSTADALIVGFTGHAVGVGHTLYLPVRGTDPDRLPDTAIDVGQWLNIVEYSADAVPTLFLLDVCQAGTAALYQIMQNVVDRDRKAWVIAGCAPDENAFSARFTTALTAVLDKLRNGRLDLSPTWRSLPVEFVAEEIDRELTRRSGQEDLPQTVFHTATLAATSPVPTFFTNPAYTEDPDERLRHRLDAALREIAEAAVPGLDVSHFLTRASGMPHRTAALGACLFTGRVRELATIRSWLEGSSPVLVVTGSPGAGKSALLGVVTCLCHPQLLQLSVGVRARIPAGLRPAVAHPHFAAVHGRFRSTEEMVTSIAAQLGLNLPTDPTEWSVDDLANRLAALPEPPIVVIDAVDEVRNGQELVETVILPLLARSRDSGEPLCRVIVGVRPWWDRFGELRGTAQSQGVMVDLSSSTPEEQLAGDLAAYVEDLLAVVPTYTSHDRQVLARAAGDRLAPTPGSFLLASLFTDFLIRTAPLPVEQAIDRMPTDLPGMIQLQLEATHDPWIQPILTVVAHAEGQGMPLDLIHLYVQAVAVDGAPPLVEDVRRALSEVAFYLRMGTDTDGRSLYRFFHQSLTEYFLDEGHEVFVANALLAAVPYEGPVRAWHRASPYLLRHALDHAADASNALVDTLFLDPAFLVYAERDTVVRNLPAATSVIARRHAAIYASACPYLGDAPPERRRQLLVLNAVRQHHPDLARCLWHVPTEGDRPALVPRWATGPYAAPNLILTFGPATADTVTALAVGQGAAGAVVLVGGADGVVDVHEAVHGAALFTLDGHDGRVTAIDTMNLCGMLIAVSGSDDGAVRLWNLADGSLLAELRDPELPVAALCLEEVDGVPVAHVVTTTGGIHVVNLDDGTTWYSQADFPLDVWSMDIVREGDQLGVDMLCASEFADDAEVTAAALGSFCGRTVEVLGRGDGSVTVWERRGEEALLRVLEAYDGSMMELQGSRWPTPSGLRARAHHLGDHDDRRVSAVTWGRLDGAPVVVAAYVDGGVRVWDVAYPPLTGYRMIDRTPIALERLEERDVVVTERAARDIPVWDRGRKKFQVRRVERQVRVWNAADGREDVELEERAWTELAEVAGPGGAIRATNRTDLDGRPVVVEVGDDDSIYVRDATTGERVGCPAHLDHPSDVELAVSDAGVAVSFGREVAMFDWASSSDLAPDAYPDLPCPRESHLVVWFPGELLIDDPGTGYWCLYSVDAWRKNGPNAEPTSSLGAPIDVGPEVLGRWAAGLLDRTDLDVLDFEEGYYEVSQTEDFVDALTCPAFTVVTLPRPRSATRGGTP